jgi:hypothetical protein
MVPKRRGYISDWSLYGTHLREAKGIVCDLCPSDLEFVAPADGHHLEADLAKSITIKDHATVKHERGLFHGVIHGTPVDDLELFPFRRDDDRFAVLRSRKRRVGNRNLLLDCEKEDVSS